MLNGKVFKINSFDKVTNSFSVFFKCGFSIYVAKRIRIIYITSTRTYLIFIPQHKKQQFTTQCVLNELWSNSFLRTNIKRGQKWSILRRELKKLNSTVDSFLHWTYEYSPINPLDSKHGQNLICHCLSSFSRMKFRCL